MCEKEIERDRKREIVSEENGKVFVLTDGEGEERHARNET